MNKTTVISADTEQKFFEFLKYRQLIYFMTWREFKVRYKQTVLGVLWTVLQPLMFAGVMAFLIVSRSGFDFGLPNASTLTVIIFSFSVWAFFEGSFSGSINSILSNQGLLKKVYFPKVILLISTILTRFVDFFLSFIVFLVFLFATGSEFAWSGFLYIIPGLLVLALTAFASALILAPLNVKYRDIKLTLPFVTRLMFFTTPIWYPFSVIPEKFQSFFLLNPVVSVIELLRNGMFAPERITLESLIYPLITLSILLAIGIPYFKKHENSLADYV